MRNDFPVLIKKLFTDVKTPQYETKGSVGFDLRAYLENEYIVIEPKETKLIGTGLQMQIPIGCEVQIRPRSGLSLNTKLRIANSPATIDSDFRGEVKIIAENTGDTPIVINHQDRIAQGVLAEVPQADFYEVDELNETERGDGGFGHTGTN